MLLNAGGSEVLNTCVFAGSKPRRVQREGRLVAKNKRKSPFATPVERFKVKFSLKSSHLRRLSSVCLSKISMFDACASDVGPKAVISMRKSPFATPVERF